MVTLVTYLFPLFGLTLRTGNTAGPAAIAEYPIVTGHAFSTSHFPPV